MKLFEYAILYVPTDTFDGNGNRTTPAAKVLVDPVRILCRDDKEAGTKAARAIPEDYLEKLDEVQVLVRPF